MILILRNIELNISFCSRLDLCVQKTCPDDDLEDSQIKLSSYIRAGKSDSMTDC